MQTRLTGALLIALVAAGCGGKKNGTDNGTTVADTGLRRDTSGMTSPAPMTSDSMADTSRHPMSDSVNNSSSTSPSTPKNRGGQTQSGVTDRAGHSTLGPGVRKTRPDADKPVTAKGDTLSTTPGSSTNPGNTPTPGTVSPGNSYSPGSTVVPGAIDSQSHRMDNMPKRSDSLTNSMDSSRNRMQYDTTRSRLNDTTSSYRSNPLSPRDTTPLPLDTTRIRRDSLTPPMDSLHPTPVPTPADSMRPNIRTDSTRSDTTKPNH